MYSRPYFFRLGRRRPKNAKHYIQGEVLLQAVSSGGIGSHALVDEVAKLRFPKMYPVPISSKSQSLGQNSGEIHQKVF